RGLGTSVAALTVASRHVRYVVPFLLQLCMFATPSVYMHLADEPAAVASRPAADSAAPAGSHPEASRVGQRPASPVVRAALALNPMTGLIGAFRSAMLGGPVPWGRLGPASARGAVALLVGCLYFRKVEDGFVDII